MLLDYHLHTPRCGHATGEMEAYLLQAQRAGLDEIGFSDHDPPYFLPEAARYPGIGMTETELPEYVAEVMQLAQRHPELPVRLGLEADYVAGQEERLAALLAPYPWDYVIGSVHFVNGWDLTDERFLERYAATSALSLSESYFFDVQGLARSGLFQIAGHFDVVDKFFCGHTQLAREVAIAALEELRKAGMAIEINSSGLRYPKASPFPARWLVQEAITRHIPFVLGSDAHAPHRVGAQLHRIAAWLQSLGVTSVLRFHNREASPVPLG
ncbi:MAG: histidinol-phosphatase HisJ family protein [Firmicutes bacterium]|nr:histidinol-phosphatase HisJ family protein [Bacillota bacterium]